MIRFGEPPSCREVDEREGDEQTPANGATREASPCGSSGRERSFRSRRHRLSTSAERASRLSGVGAGRSLRDDRDRRPARPARACSRARRPPPASELLTYAVRPHVRKGHEGVPGVAVQGHSGWSRGAQAPSSRHEHTHTHIPEIPEIRRLQRSRSDRMVAGVSGGLARYFEIHPAVFRVGFVVLTLLGGAGILIYAAAALVMPDEGKEDSIATAALRNRRDRPWPLIGLGLLAVAAAALLSRVSLWPQGRRVVPLPDRGRRDPLDHASARTPTRRSRRDGARQATDSRRLRRLGKWVAITLATLIALVLVAVATFLARVRRPLQPRRRRPQLQRHARARPPKRVPARNRHARPRSPALRLPVGETHVDASVDVGDLRVIVPEGVGLKVHGDRRDRRGRPPRRRRWQRQQRREQLRRARRRVLVLDGHAGLGSVTVERALR